MAESGGRWAFKRQECKASVSSFSLSEAGQLNYLLTTTGARFFFHIWF